MAIRNFLFVFAFFITTSQLFAEDDLSLKDDASLNAVRFFDAQNGWAVGDRGTIWKTIDSGKNWSLQKSLVAVRLNDAFFLSSKLGWIVGGDFDRPLGVSKGVLLKTIDGGANWEIQKTGNNPEFQKVQFFNLKRGVLMGLSSPANPTGVLMTIDGGKQWMPVTGKLNGGWRTGHFFNPDTGIVAGRNGQQAVVGNGQLLTTAGSEFGAYTIHNICFGTMGNGWMVGQGGLVLQTQNSGVSWLPIKLGLQGHKQEIFDFRAVASVGENEAWISGSPGRFIWHTADAGKTWQRQSTGVNSRIHSIHFTNPMQGTAVGDWGTILTTQDGGKNWAVVKGAERRLGILTISTAPSASSFDLHVKYGLEEGYRSATVLLVDSESKSPSLISNNDLRLHDAVVKAGGNFVETNWTLPLGVPGIDGDPQKLAVYWNKKTDGRLAEIVVGRLVTQIRNLRPEIVVIDSPVNKSGASKLVSQAVLNAVEAAGDSTQFLELQSATGLEAWKVPQIFQCVDGINSEFASNPARIDPYEFLKRQRSTISSFMTASKKLLSNKQHNSKVSGMNLLTSDFTSRFYQPIRISNGQMRANENKFSNRLFAGRVHFPGTAIRRKISDSSDDSDSALKLKLAQQERNFSIYSKQAMLDSVRSSQLIGQINDLTSQRSDEDAARQMIQLAERYRATGQFENAEAVCEAIINRYPESDYAKQSMVWLIQFWTSDEIFWQRIQKQSFSRTAKTTSKSQVINQYYQQLEKQKSTGIQQASSLERVNGWNEKEDVNNLRLREDPRRAQMRKRWKDRAAALVKDLQENSNGLFNQPEVQFPMAALMRQRQIFKVSDEIYRKFRREEDISWSRAARSELWLLQPVGFPPKPMTRVPEVNQKPFLDAVISDPVWQVASEIRLKSGEEYEDKDSQAVVWMACDKEYLYLAAMVPRHKDLPIDPAVADSRTHDADLSSYDRLRFCFDVDRDYSTYYSFEVDQRGQTSDACWTKQDWNPTWHVAAKSDAKSWRVEMAIPWKELTARKPTSREYWNLSVTRTMPTVGLQSWPLPAVEVAKPEMFGFAKFD